MTHSDHRFSIDYALADFLLTSQDNSNLIGPISISKTDRDTRAIFSFQIADSISVTEVTDDF